MVSVRCSKAGVSGGIIVHGRIPVEAGNFQLWRKCFFSDTAATRG